MVQSTCNNCGGTFHWCWEEAFDKFGFNDGDGQIETWDVKEAIESLGYTVQEHEWGLHNIIIGSIVKDGIEQIPEGANVGYADPRLYLPDEIITFLDKEFPSACRYYNAGAER